MTYTKSYKKVRRTYRSEGYLNTLWTQGTPKHLFYFDTETYIEYNEYGEIIFPFRLGYIIYHKLDKQGNIKLEEKSTIQSGKQIISYIEERLGKNDKAYVFAHNIGFDCRVLNIFKEADKLGYTSKPPIINNMVFIWGIKKLKRMINFIDTANLGVRSVEQLGLDMGYEKMSVDFDNVDDDTLLSYCIRDVEILAKFVSEYIRFIREHKLGNFKVTLAGQALQAYRTSFNNNDIYIHMHYGGLVIERDAYYGGRTEAFRKGYIGQQNYYYVDVNSMYPHVMSQFPLPVKLKTRIKNPTMVDIDKYKDHYLIADVKLDTNTNIYPLRLSNNPKEYNYLSNPNNSSQYPELSTHRLIFPIGRFTTTLHNIELERALLDNDVVDVNRLYVYEKGYPFKDYVSFFYELKNRYGHENNKTWRLITKLFLNSLYGKFGQLLPHRELQDLKTEKEIGREAVYDHIEDLRYQLLYWFGDIYKEFKLGETAFSSPAIAGSITAYARYVLYSYIESAGRDNVYYMDTDSLITNEVGYKNLEAYIDSEKLGYLDLERTGRRLIIYGNKDYRLDATKRIKGIPSKAKKIRANTWQYLQFQGFITWLNNGGIGGAIGRNMIKTRLGRYTKGIVQDNGVIIPFHLLEF